MDNKKLTSYEFSCPCCKQKHKRLFEYYAKLYGPIPEDMSLEKFDDYQMLPRVVIDESNIESRTISAGDNAYRCGNCFEFFKFDGELGEPRPVFGHEKSVVMSRFKPIELTKEQAVLNSLAMLDQMINSCGCVYDEEKNEIVTTSLSGKQFSFKFVDELVKNFYGKNLNFKVKGFSQEEDLSNQQQKDA